ncbi:failed axon connections homolog [Pollicipes pollicipes]|uniref:failed axon connections homolog n=1 Tax=Pollicipes pollicipes TaxID=41117 RepID=UPI001884B2FB|nr:failed axon connections homolog [Pollicipes pollicipes]
MAGFQYVVDTSKPLGPKGKCPWITVNGVDVTDSELIIEHLLTLRPHALPAYRALTPQQHALGRVVQVALDEHLVLAVAAHRFVVDGMRHLVPMMAPRYRRRYRLLRPLAALWATASFRSIGWDRDREELVALMHRDLTALADLLGDRPYLLGDEVTPYDAAVFGQLTQLMTGCAPAVGGLVCEFPSLVRYFERLRARFWPDWAHCLSP